jgi:hypothetical protein
MKYASAMTGTAGADPNACSIAHTQQLRRTPVRDRARESRVSQPNQLSGLANRVTDQPCAGSNNRSAPVVARRAASAVLRRDATAARERKAESDAEHRRGGRDRAQLDRPVAVHEAKRQDYSRKRDRAEEDRVEHDQEDEQSAGRGLRA